MYIKMSLSPKEWLKISEEFQVKWNLPDVVGALGGKHIRIRCFSKTGSFYHNNKGFSVRYCWLCLSIHNIYFGQYGSNNESGVLLKSSIGKKLVLNNTFLLPPALKDVISIHRHTFL